MTGSCPVCGNVGCNCDLRTVVAGIDVSTKAIDLVLLDMETDRAEWHRYELGKGDLIQRVQNIRHWPINRYDWENWLAIGIERPAGKHGVAQVSMAFGAVLAKLPGGHLVQPWQPAEWRKACGMKGNASKVAISNWTIGHWLLAGKTTATWPQDAHDAYCIAYATRSVLEISEAA